MANSIEYKVIKSLCEDLVNAISPSINVILNKAWSRNIISKEQLDTSIESNSSQHRKSSTLVSAIATKVHLDKENFYMLIDLLKDAEDLEYIVRRLEDLHSKLTQEAREELAASVLSTHDSESEDKMPKLKPDENVESGLGEYSHDQEPIASEIVTLSGEASGSRIDFPNRVVRKPFKSLTPSYTGLVSVGEVENSVDFEQDWQIVPAVLEDGNTANQSLVVAPNKQASKTTTSNGPSLIERSLEVINIENQSNLRKIDNLQEQLLTSKASECKLQCDVQQLKNENDMLEHQLRTKEEETKQSKEMFNREIKDVKSKLQEKETEVSEIKKKLGKVEQENEIQRRKYLLKIDQLQSERNELESKANSLEQKNEQNRLQLLELQEQVNKKNSELNDAQAELNKTFREICNLEVQLAKSKTVIAEQRADAAEKKFHSETKDKAAEIKKMEDDNAAKIKKIEEDNEQQLQVHRRNSVPVDVHDKCLKEMEEMRTRLKHVSLSVDHQSSLTESAQPSPSCSSGPESQDSMDNSTTDPTLI